MSATVMVDAEVSLSTILVGTDMFWYVVMIRDSDNPFWLGEVRVRTIDIVVDAGTAANPVIFSL